MLFARAAAPGPEQAEALHEARKAAKRARYAGETALPVAGRRARRFTDRMKAVQDLLGEHQDAIVAAGALRARAAADGDRAFAYGVLYAGQSAAAQDARRQLPEVWARADGRRLARF